MTCPDFPQNGAMQALCHYLRCYPTFVELQQQILELMTIWLSDSVHQVKAVEGGCLEEVSKSVQNLSYIPEIVEAGAKVLALATTVYGVEEYAAEAGVLEALLVAMDALRSGDAQRYAATALLKLCSGTHHAAVKRKHQAAQATDILDRLTSSSIAMYGGDEDLHREILELLQELKAIAAAEAERRATMSASHSSPSVHSDDPEALFFTLQDGPAIIEDTGDISYHGSIKPEADACYASFPGKYAAGWDALLKESHGQSVACVFLCTPVDGLGKHHEDPEAEPNASVRCYCPKIYGERDWWTFGYLQVVPASSKAWAREKALATGAVVLSEEASPEERRAAKAEAHKAWEESGRTASWGCEWFHVWKKRVAEAVELKQRLKVVYFPGQVGRGKVAWDELPRANLWDGAGCGGSQKCEIAYLDTMRKLHGPSWDYDHVDVSHFLEEEFRIEGLVDAFDGKTWWRGKLLAVPEGIPLHPEEAQWKVQSSATGKVFVTDRVRHAEVIDKLLEAVGVEKCLQLLEDILPEGVRIGRCEQVILPDGTPALAVGVEITEVQTLQELRDLVLGDALQLEINQFLPKKWHIRVDKTQVCKLFEKTLKSLTELTADQEHNLHHLKLTRADGRDVHLSACAGAGKTFLAIEYARYILETGLGDDILYVAPSASLGFYFVRWLLLRCASKEKLLHLRSRQVKAFMKRLYVLYPPYDCLMNFGTDGNWLVNSPVQGGTEVMKFMLLIVDEAHDLYRSDVDHRFLERIQAEQKLLLSNRSQSSAVCQTFPDQLLDLVLYDVVRCSKRIVAGAAAFTPSELDKKNMGRATGPAGPPLKTFIFQASAAASDLMSLYVQNTMAALWHIVHTYSGLSLNDRIALVVPDVNFLRQFKPALEENLKKQFPHRNFCLVNFEQCSRTLPHYVLSEAQLEEIAKEVIVLDSIDNAKGLEQLIVFCIGLDARINGTESDFVARARIFQGLTRAQLQAIVINELIIGGWLQWLGYVTFNESFQEEAALQETTADPSEEVLTRDIKIIPHAAVKSEACGPVRTASVSDPKAELAGTEKQGVRESCVWDNSGNQIGASIDGLLFDPWAGEVKSMEELEEFVRTKQCVSCINFAHTKYGSEGAKAVVEALKVYPDLAHIKLQRSNFNEDCMKVLAEVLKEHRGVRSIDFTCNEDFTAECAQVLAEVMKVNQSLRHINLTACPLGSGAKALAEVLKTNSTVTEICLRDCSMKTDDVEALLEALRVNRTVIYLDLEMNDTSPEIEEAKSQVVEEKRAAGINLVTTHDQRLKLEGVPKRRCFR